MSGELTSCDRMEKSSRRTARRSSFSNSTWKKFQKMAKSKKRAIEGAWPLIDVRCGDLDPVFLSDRVHVSFRLAIYVRSFSVPKFDLSFMRSMFFALFDRADRREFQKLPQDCPSRLKDADVASERPPTPRRSRRRQHRRRRRRKKAGLASSPAVIFQFPIS